MTASEQMGAFCDLLAELKAGGLRPVEFSDKVRAMRELLAALPARYQEVLLALLDRLESGALFTEESCSFSANQLHDALEQWADKAKQQLVHHC